MIEIDAPDGTVVEFPDGTPDAVIASAMRRTYGGPAAPAQQAAPAAAPLIKSDGSVDTDTFLRTVQPGWTPAAPTPPVVDVPYDELGGLGAGLRANPPTPAAATPRRTRTLTDVILDRPPEADSTIAGAATQTARGLREGVANLVGLPVDAVNNAPRLANLLNLVPGVSGIDVGPISPKPFGGSQSVDALLGGFGLIPEPPAPQGFGERFARRVGQEIGAASVPAAGALGTAVRVGVQGARELPRLARMFVEPAAVDPLGYVRREATAAAAAGTGAGLANEATRAAGADPNGAKAQLADFGGAVGGVGAAGLVSGVSRGVANVFKAVTGSPNYVDDVVRERVADEIARAAGLATGPGVAPDVDPLVAQILSRDRVSATVPGFTESLADRTANPGIAALEYSRQSGPNSGMFAQRRSANAAAVDTAMARNAPQATPGAFSSELAAARDARLADASAATAAARDAAASAAAPLAPQTTPQARGSVVRSAVDEAMARFIADAQEAQRRTAAAAQDAIARLAPRTEPAVRGNAVRSTLETARDTMRAATSDAYESIGTNGRTVDAAGLTAALDDVSRSLTPTERTLVPQRLIDETAALGRGSVDEAGAPVPPPPAQIKAATDLRSELLRRQRAALADPRAENGGRNAARVIGRYVDVVESFVRQHLTPDELATSDAARAQRFQEAEAFGRTGDVVNQAVSRYEGGQPRVRDERVAGLFVDPKTDQPLQRLFTQADTPEVRGAIRDEIASRLGPPGRVDADKMAAFVEDYAIPLRQFPGLRDEIMNAAGAQRGAQAAEAAVGARRQEFAGDSRALAETTARRADGTPALLDEQVAGRFVNPTGNRDLDALFSRADTPEVRNAIRDEMLSKLGPGADRADGIQRFVADYAQPLQRFPGLREELGAAASARADLAAAEGAETSLQRMIGKDGNGVVARYLRYGDENADRAMKAVLADKQPAKAIDELLAYVKDDPAAVDGARKVFWDIMQQKGRSAGETTKTLAGTQPWLPNRLKGFLDDPRNAAVAERLWRDQPEHLDNVRKIAEVLQGVETRGRAKAPNTSGTPQGMSQLLTPESLQSRAYAYYTGRIKTPFLVTSIVSVVARRAVRAAQTDAIGRMLDEALLDPDKAALLLKENNPANRAALARSTKAWMGNEASTLLDLLNDKDETVEAVTRKDAQ